MCKHYLPNIDSSQQCSLEMKPLNRETVEQQAIHRYVNTLKAPPPEDIFLVIMPCLNKINIGEEWQVILKGTLARLFCTIRLTSVINQLIYSSGSRQVILTSTVIMTDRGNVVT